MSNNLKYATVKTPTPESRWVEVPETARLALITQAIESSNLSTKAILELVSAKGDGQVTVRFREPVGAAKRGTMLLDLEAHLKEEVDQGITIWLEPLGDKNSLRKLRGIEVKA